MLPYVVTFALFGLGLYALQKLLAPVDLAEVVDQVHAIPLSTKLIALGATLCAYLALAGYDWSALRYIGKPLPLPTVLTGGLMAYAFGNTIGLSAVSGGAVRWRVYSALGLDGYDVAAVSTFAAVSYGIAATVVGLAALAAHPGALASFLPFGPDLVRIAALAAIAVIVVPLVLAARSGRALRLGRFRVRAPSLPILAGQVVFSFADITFSALTLYVLMPAGPDFLTFLAVFAAAVLAGVISHVPGGVGVFEAVVIAAMPAHMPVGQVAAALLLFRITYYLLPFAIALVVLALYEAWRTIGLFARTPALSHAMKELEPGLRAVAPVGPLVLSAMIFGAGLWMSLSSLIPPTSDAAEAAEVLLPDALTEGRRLLTSAMGAWLIVLALGVVRRSLGAWWLSVGVLAAGALTALLDGPDTRQALALLGAIVVLLPFRRAFHRHTTLTHAALSPGWILLVLSAIVAFGFVFFFANKSLPYQHELWWQFAMDERAPRTWRAGLVGSLIVGVTALALLLLVPRDRPSAPDADARARAAALVATVTRPGAARAAGEATALMFSPDGLAFLGWCAEGGVWRALGGAHGTGQGIEELAARFADSARRAGARPVFADLDAGQLALAVDLGLTPAHSVRALTLDLAAMPAEGPADAAVRTGLARALAGGQSFAFGPEADNPLAARATLTRGGAEVAQARLWWAGGGVADLAQITLGEGEGTDTAAMLLAVLALRLRAEGATALAYVPDSVATAADTVAALLRLGAVGAMVVTAEPVQVRPLHRPAA